MTTGLVIAIISLASAVLVLSGGLIYFARAAIARADGKGASDTAAEKARGESAIDARKVEEAREAVNEIDVAREAAEDRAHVLENAANDQAAIVNASDDDVDELFKESVSGDTNATGGTAARDSGSGTVSHGQAGGPRRTTRPSG